MERNPSAQLNNLAIHPPNGICEGVSSRTHDVQCATANYVERSRACQGVDHAPHHHRGSSGPQEFENRDSAASNVRSSCQASLAHDTSGDKAEQTHAPLYVSVSQA